MTENTEKSGCLQKGSVEHEGYAQESQDRSTEYGKKKTMHSKTDTHETL